MAIIQNLSVVNGGGIISSASQCVQKNNQVSIFIGLGGTGVDALRSVKTQINERLIPDNDQSYNDPTSDVSIRNYNHIKFLGIDSDNRTFTSGDMTEALDPSEQFNISMAGMAGAGVLNTQMRPYLSWVSSDEAIARVIAKGDGAGGIRQAGRFLLFDKIDSIMSKISNMITEAKTGFAGQYRVVVHIFSGISGGTGSGTFLDVCYAVREVLKPYPQATIMGYFFTPDINLSKPIDEATRMFIPMNGYAAMQELNYCMGIPRNGGSFRQLVKGGKQIDWDCPPVDMCHLIGAQTEAGNVITGNAYEYAMKTVTEYVMDFLAENPDDKFDAYQLGSNQNTRISMADNEKTAGYNPCVVSIGAACASIPYREINTYLAAGIFEAYEVQHSTRVADKASAVQVMFDAWKRVNDTDKSTQAILYMSLMQMLSGNPEYGVQQYSPYSDGSTKPWNTVLMSNGSNGNVLEAHYVKELHEHIGVLATQADMLTREESENALINALATQLELIIKDITRGPAFAKALLDSVDDNILSIIRGLKDLNSANYSKELANEGDKRATLEASRQKFVGKIKGGLFESDKDRYAMYENAVFNYAMHIELVGGVYSNEPNAKPVKGIYQVITDVLNALEKQVLARIKNYYAPLTVVVNDLTETFINNKAILSNAVNNDQAASDFEMKLVTISDLRTLLDARIKELPMGDVFASLMVALENAGYEVWVHPETRLPKVLQNFFVGTAEAVFKDFAGTSIDTFLENKYGVVGDTLSMNVASDWIDTLMRASAPLLHLDSSLFNAQQFYTKRASFPSTSEVLKKAITTYATQVDSTWAKNPNVIRDRILFIQIRDGFPMQANSFMTDLENQFYMSSATSGLHLYEKAELDDMKLPNWHNLPTITIPSNLTGKVLSQGLKTKVDEFEALYTKCVELGVINSSSNFVQQISDDFVSKLNAMEATLATLAEDGSSVTEKTAKVDAIEAELAALKTQSPLVDSTYNLMAAGGNVGSVEFLKRDYFYAAPVIQLFAKETIEAITSINERFDAISKAIDGKRVELMTLESNTKKEFFLALFTGVIKCTENGSVVYEYKENGIIDKTETLAAYGLDLTYEDIPLFQAYVSYLALPDTLIKQIKAEMNSKRGLPASREFAAQFKAENVTDGNISSWLEKANSYYGDKPIVVKRIEMFIADLRRFSL